MSRTSESADLTGKLLIAMPGMGDPRFEKSVVFMCAHSNDGSSMGLIINKPTPGVTLDDLLEQLSIKKGKGSSGVVVHFGGPVEHGRGFVLHTTDYVASSTTLEIAGGYGMTATLDILEDVARGAGPAFSLFALGYAGWAPGQLEMELQQNGWLTCDASHDIVFGMNDAAKWGGALKSLGVDPLVLSAEGGRA